MCSFQSGQRPPCSNTGLDHRFFRVAQGHYGGKKSVMDGMATSLNEVGKAWSSMKQCDIVDKMSFFLSNTDIILGHCYNLRLIFCVCHFGIIVKCPMG